MLKSFFAAIAIALMVSAALAGDCSLIGRYWAGLPKSRAAVKTQAQFEALSPKLQHIACMTRAFYNKVHAQHGKINHFDNYNPDYLSPAENVEVTTAIHHFMERELCGKGGCGTVTVVHTGVCRVTDRDLASLAKSRAAVKTQAQFEALSSDLQHIACETRAFYNKVHSQHGNINRVDNYSPDYLSPAENAEVTKAIHLFFRRKLLHLR